MSKGRFSRNMSEYRITESESESKALALLAYYGIRAERGLYVPKFDQLECEKCGSEGADPTLPAFLKAEEFKPTVTASPCKGCGGTSYKLPWYVVDLTFSRRCKIIGEVKGTKSSADDPKKIAWLRAHGYWPVIIRNEMVAQPEDFKAVCQALAIAVGTDKPDKLWEVELA
ncbi:MAG: hypothetical protein KGI38_11490 [Thaumarchaeota archaeon]|nr:hypothetical protein [Nitrososphaerota archaeon]